MLADKQYVNEINELICEITEEYAALPYARDQLSNVQKSDLELTISDQLFLDVLLMKIRGKTISYATAKKKLNTEQEQTLEKLIEDLEKKHNPTDYD